MSLYRRLLLLSSSSSGGGGDEPSDVDGYAAFLSDFDDTMTPNKYINSGGGESNYNGWNISGWVEIPSDAPYAYCHGITANYTGIYNASKTYMQHFADGAMPAGAKYIRISDTAAKVAAGFIVFLKDAK